MSYFTGLPSDKNRENADRRLASIKHRGNRKAFSDMVARRRAAGEADPSTLASDTDEYKRFCAWVGNRSITRLKPNDIIAFFGTIIHKEHSTRYKTYVVLKRFFREFHGLEEDEKPPEFKGFKIKRPPKSKVQVEDLLTPDDFASMLRFARDSKERSLASILYEVGPRAAEILSVDLRHVDKDQYGYLITIPDKEGNKTGGRRVRIRLAEKELDEWLNNGHKMRDNLDAPLYYGMSNRARYQRMGYQTLYELIKRLARDAKLKKRVWPHLFRHTAATEAAKRGLLGPALCRLMGWTDDTDMQAIYVHLSQADCDDQVLKSHGVVKDGPKPRSGLQPIICLPCKTENPPDRLFCKRSTCGAPLTPLAEKVIQENKQETLQAMVALEVRKILEQKAAALGT